MKSEQACKYRHCSVKIEEGDSKTKFALNFSATFIMFPLNFLIINDFSFYI